MQKKQSKNYLLHVLVALIFTALLASGFLKNGLIPIHDTTHPARLKLLKQTLASGQFPAVWADQANYTLGYPLFHFYAPLFYYLALIPTFLGASYILSINLTVFFTIFLGIFAIMRFTKKYGIPTSLLAGAAFTTLPYLALDIYVRGAYSELLALSLLPLLFLAWRNPQNNPSNNIKTALITSLFLLSHNLIPLITAPFLLLWLLINKTKPARIFVSGILTLLLSAFYLAPLLLERSFTQAFTIAKSTDFNLHFVQPWQLWNSTWGFGGSAPGVQDGISFKLGKAQLLLAGGGTLAALLCPKAKLKKTLFFTFLASFAAFLTTPYSKIIWQNLPLLPYVQFPWRFLGLIGFSLAVLSGIFLKFFKHSHTLRVLFFLFFSAGLFYLNLKYFQPENNFRLSSKDVTSDAYIEKSLSSKVPEYLPRWAPKQAETYLGKLLKGKHLKNLKITRESDKYTLDFELTSPETVTISKLYYPTWQITEKGTQLEPFPSETGLLQLKLEKGKHTLSLSQANTDIQKLSLYLSLTTLLASFIMLFVTNQGNRKADQA